jgi:hypothetical protein
VLRGIDQLKAQRALADRRFELVAGAFRDHAAVIDHRQALRQSISLLQILSRQEHGGAVGRDLAHELPHLIATARIETRGGLVEEENLGPRDEAGRDIDATTHPSRVGTHLLPGGVGKGESVQQLGCAPARI